MDVKYFFFYSLDIHLYVKRESHKFLCTMKDCLVRVNLSLTVEKKTLVLFFFSAKIYALQIKISSVP